MRDSYFEEELSYLHEAGKRFAQAYPDRASFLNLESVKDKDPTVERLLEGFAFLTSRIHQRLDDGVPEISEGLMQLLCPEFLRPLPSMCIMEFRPRKGMLQNSYIINNGTEVLGVADTKSPVVCRFSLEQSVKVNPIAITKVSNTQSGSGTKLFIELQLDPGIQSGELDISPLRFFLGGDLFRAIALRELLLEHMTGCSIRAGNSCVQLDPKEAIRSAGFDHYGEHHPFCLIRDYFAFPEKFLFLDFFGLDSKAVSDSNSSTLCIDILLDSMLPPKHSLSQDHFKLHCVPAINIFRKDTEPVTVTGQMREYPLYTDISAPESFHLYSITQVIGINNRTGAKTIYPPFTSFDGNSERFYTLRRSPDDKQRMYISMGGRQLNETELIEENLHIAAFQTNGDVPRMLLSENCINKPSSGFPDYISFANITRPTSPLHPCREAVLSWILISHLFGSITGVTDAEQLRRMLDLYDWTEQKRGSQKTRAIQSLKLVPIQEIKANSIMRGIELHLEIEESGFQGDGDLHFFGTLLLECLGSMVSINTSFRLTIHLIPSGKCMRWQSRSGTRTML